MLLWVIHKLTCMVFHQSPEAASGAPISHTKSSKDNPAHSANTNSPTESSKDDPAHPANTIMSLNLLDPEPLMPNSMTEIEEEGYYSQVQTILAPDNVRDTIPETASRTTSGPGSNLVIQEKVIQPPSEISSYTSQGPCRTSLTIRQARQKNIGCILDSQVQIARFQRGLVKSSLIQIIPEITNHIRAAVVDKACHMITG